MLISFVISSQGREERIFKTLNSLKKQVNQNYEIIIINDDPSIEKEAIDFLRDQFELDSKITLVLNSRAQGSSSNWNTGINLAKGKYIGFLKEGDILVPNFVEKIQQILEEHKPKLDIIQFVQALSGILETSNDDNQLLEADSVYDLKKKPEVFAFIDPNIYGKLFNMSCLQNFRTKFRITNRFDALFLFQVLGHAQMFYKISTPLVTHHTTILKYSVFDLVNQWPHILNYYRKIGSYKELHDQLNYAYIHQLAFDFLVLISKFNNQQLYKKALKFSSTKMKGKLGSGIKTNKIFLENKDEKFTKYIANFDDFIYNELKKIK